MSLKLNLDFIEKPALSRANWLNISILLSSLFLLVLTWQSFQNQQIKLADTSLHIKQLSQQTLPKSQPNKKSVAVMTADETKQLLDAVNMLATPWDNLLVAIEAANMPDIALLSLEPNSKKQLVVLTGEAKNLPVVLQYIKRLQQTPMLAQVYLQKHNIEESDTSKPVRFSLLAKWDLADQSVVADN